MQVNTVTDVSKVFNNNITCITYPTKGCHQGFVKKLINICVVSKLKLLKSNVV